MKPKASDKSRICLDFSDQGLNVYANRQALIDLREQLSWLIDAPPDDDYHCHVLMALENDASQFDGVRPRNAGVMFSDDTVEQLRMLHDQGSVIDLSFFKLKDEDMDQKQMKQK